MYPLLRWLLFRLSPETAHSLAMFWLRILGRSSGIRTAIRSRLQPNAIDLSVSIGSLTFPNPVGLAAGLDKNATSIQGLFALGFGAVEVGTVTPRPQVGNPQPRVFRVPEYGALINRLGFNNDGASAVAGRLGRLVWRPAPLGVNIGKNKDTPNENATEDYVECVRTLGSLADYLVINVSSPNTPGLRELQKPEHLRDLLKQCSAALRPISAPKPLLLKISPDLSDEDLDAVLGVASSCHLSGVIATNTTLQRPFQHASANEVGGLSGRPLGLLSTQILRRIYNKTGGRMPIISVGGIFTAEEAYRRIRCGASMVQVYTGLIYEGPGMVARILRGLTTLLCRDGFQSIKDAQGKEFDGKAS